MKYLNTILMASVFMLPTMSNAQSMLEQIEAVDQAHQQHRSIELKEEKARKARANAKAKEREIRIQAEKERDENYEDGLREIYLEERRLDLEQKRAKTHRANDYIDRDLKRMDAETDVIQSIGDSNRNVSVGAKDMMQGIGVGASKFNDD